MTSLLPPWQVVAANAAEGVERLPLPEAAPPSPPPLPDYSRPGPLQPARLPRLEHTCARCFPACTTNKCLLRLDVWYPKNGASQGLSPPYPLAIITSGFLVSSEAYASYAQRLASWGYTAILYDKVESAVDSLDDELSARFIYDLMDWAETDPLMRKVADTRRVYLLGHSRGAKIATLAAAGDARVAALCLIDPVDNTVYAPLGPGYPSATQALRNLPARRSLPVAIIGSSLGGDCVPANANYSKFYAASPGTAWEVLLNDTGHFQFLDRQTIVQQAICAQGLAPDASVRRVTQAVAVAWGESMVRGSGGMQMAVNSEGNWVKGFASMQTARALFATTSRIESLLNRAGSDVDGRPLSLTTRIKNVSLLDVDNNTG